MAGLTDSGFGSSALPSRLQALLDQAGPGYADGGAVPMQQPPMPMQPPMPQGQPGVAPQGGGMDPAQLQQAVQQFAQSNPQVIQQLQQQLQQLVQSGQIQADQLNLLLELAKAAASNPGLYPRLRQLAIERGLATPEEMPEQFDQGIVFSLLLAAQAAQGATAAPKRTIPAGMADGGHIPSSGNDPAGRADNIPIKVSGGEYVIPKHVVAAKGTEYFDKLLASYDPNNPDAKVNKG